MTGPVRPGSTIGFFGAGQLGRMTALAARSLGYDVRVLDPEPDPPAGAVASRAIVAAFDDVRAAEELARGCDVLTVEIEKVAVASLEAAARHAPVRPSPGVLYTVQDRGRQKAWLAAGGFPVGPYRSAHSAAECATAVEALGGPCFAKSCAGGYDGRGQVRIADAAGAEEAWRLLGARPVVVERVLDLRLELSVLVARRPGGEAAVYPPALNLHTAGILTWSVLPGPLPDRVAADATEIARGIARALDLEGLVTVEMFYTRDGALLVNELAPRTHNSFHATEEACLTSQFEQHVRAICDLPLGATDVVRPAAIVNLLGDLWHGQRSPAFEAALAIRGVRLHLYGKRDPRPGRKMGHLAATGADTDEALATVLDAYARLGGRVGPP